MSHPGGRPSDYRPEYCALVEELGAKGFSVVQMAAEIGCDRKTLEQRWPEANPEFCQSFNRAKMLSQAWWEEIGRANLITPQGVNFQSSVWSRSMAARFPADWRENSKVENTHSNPDGSPLGIVVTFAKSAPAIDDEGGGED